MSEKPDGDATLKIELALPDVPWILKVTVEEVALTPATVPSSRRRPVERVVSESQRVKNPGRPPDTPGPPVMPSVEVATHLVDVPVAWSTIPSVPEAFTLSKKSPDNERLVVELLVYTLLTPVNPEMNAFVAKRPLAETAVVDAFTTYTLENLSVEEPSPKVLSTEGVMFPATWRRSVCVVEVPIPT